MDFQEIICNKNLIIANKGAITGGVLTCLFFDNHRNTYHNNK